MRHIYDKLGAHRRREAVDLARGLGLLAPAGHVNGSERSERSR